MGSCTERPHAAESTSLNSTFNVTSPKHEDTDSYSTQTDPNQFAHDFSRIPAHARERVQWIPGSEIKRQGPPRPGSYPPLPQPVIPGVYDCKPPYNPDEVTNALDTAKLWIGTVVPIVELFKMRRLTETRDIAVRVALRENFNITDPFPRYKLSPQTDLDTIISNLKTIETALNKPLQFNCTRACLPGDLAWVLSNPEKFHLPRGVINICPEYFGCDPIKQASVMIHERAHESIGAEDHAYESSGRYDSLATITALENADSYAVFVRQVFHNGTYRPGLSCSPQNSRIPDFHLTDPNLRMPPPLKSPSLLPPPEDF